MNHPKREEWVPFLFGEADAQTRRELSEHLQACPACAREIQAWRRSLKRLDGWRLANRPRPWAVSWQLGLKWACASLAVLALGFIGGRLSAPSQTELAKLRTGLEAQWRADINSAVAKAQADSATAISESEARLAKATANERQQLLRNVVQLLSSARAEDARTVQALFRQIQDQHKSDLVAVRTDLETLASMTDDELRQARFKLTQLAALAQNDQKPEN